MPTDIINSLEEEHRLIAQVLKAFEVYVDSIDLRHTIERHDLYRFITFFSDFTDAIHHAKEEGVLFPALERHGFAPKVGPLGHIREQHSQERVLFARLKRAATDRHVWTDARFAELVSTGRELIEFERSHIQKEDDLLFPAARVELSEENAATLAKALERFDRIHAVEGYSDYLHRLADELIATYLPA